MKNEQPDEAREEAKLQFLARQLATAAYDYLENPAQGLIAFVDNCWMQYLNQAKYALPLLQLHMREAAHPADCAYCQNTRNIQVDDDPAQPCPKCRTPVRESGV